MKSPNLRRRCTLYLADCMDALALIPDNAAALILTDPPYSSGTRREGSKTMCGNKERAILHSNTPWQRWITTDQLTTPAFQFLMRQIGLQAARILQPGGHFVSFIDHRMLGALTPAVESADLRYNMLGVWNKQRPALGRHFRNQHELFVHFTKGTGFEPCHKRGRNVIDCPRPRKAGHPTAKPEDLIREIVELLAPAGSLIVDPFAGSGVVGAVAAATGRRAVLIDNDPANMPQLREAVPHAETIVAPSHKDRLQEFERKAAEHAAQQPDRTFAKGSLPRAARAASAAA